MLILAQKFLEQEIAKLTALVDRQQELVARLDLDGRDTELAHQVCCSLCDTLRLLEFIRLWEVQKGPRRLTGGALTETSG